MSIQAFPSTLPAPLLRGSSIQDTSAFIRTQMDNGLFRQRRRHNSQRTIFQLQFIFTRQQLNIFEDFFRHSINYVDFFTMNLLTSDGYTQQTVRFTVEPRYEVNGILFEVSCELESNTRMIFFNPVTSFFLVDFGNIDSYEDINERFNNLINVDLSNDLEW